MVKDTAKVVTSLSKELGDDLGVNRVEYPEEVHVEGGFPLASRSPGAIPKTWMRTNIGATGADVRDQADGGTKPEPIGLREMCARRAPRPLRPTRRIPVSNGFGASQM